MADVRPPYWWAAACQAAMPRFLAKTRPWPAPTGLEHLGPCAIWQGARTRGGGYRKGGGPYGSFGVCKGAIVRAGVFVCVAAGKMVPGWHTDHLCKRTLCVAEAHLEVVPPPVNSRRRWDGRRKKDLQ